MKNDNAFVNEICAFVNWMMVTEEINGAPEAKNCLIASENIDLKVGKSADDTRNDADAKKVIDNKVVNDVVMKTVDAYDKQVEA